MRYKVNDVDSIFVPDQNGVGNLFFPAVGIVTTDATPVVAATLSFPRDGLYQVGGVALAATFDGTDWATWNSGSLLSTSTFTVQGGVITPPINPSVGAPVSNGGPTSGTWVETFASSGSDLILTIQGANGVTVKWSITPIFYTNLVP